MDQLTAEDRKDLAEILQRRANEIAGYEGEKRDGMPGSVELALSREIKRLRRFASLINPLRPEDF